MLTLSVMMDTFYVQETAQGTGWRARVQTSGVLLNVYQPAFSGVVGSRLVAIADFSVPTLSLPML